MGVSIQVYRCRIGIFAASNSSVYSKSSPPTCPTSPSRWPGWAWSACLVIVLSTLPLAVHYDLQNPMQYFPNPGSTRSSTPSGSSWTSSWRPSSGCHLTSACTPPWSQPPWPSSPATRPCRTYSTQKLPLPSSHQSFTNYIFQLSKVERNFIARMEHGNRSQRGRGIKLLHWNKGPSFLKNKHHEVETLIEGHTPHVLGLSEANLKANHNLSEVQHSDYNLHTCRTLENRDISISRVVVYTHQ